MKAMATLVTRRRVLRGALVGAAALPAATGFLARASTASSALSVIVWKDPNCRCCEGWIAHMRQSGFTISVVTTDDMQAVKKARGVLDDMRSCHTALIDGGYVVEGHVPAGDIRRLISEHPPAKGLAVPGMPASAPGMDHPGQPYDVMLFGGPSGSAVYAHHTGLENADAL